jgi:hypothetical protein
MDLGHMLFGIGRSNSSPESAAAEFPQSSHAPPHLKSDVRLLPEKGQAS